MSKFVYEQNHFSKICEYSNTGVDKLKSHLVFHDLNKLNTQRDFFKCAILPLISLKSGVNEDVDYVNNFHCDNKYEKSSQFNVEDTENNLLEILNLETINVNNNFEVLKKMDIQSSLLDYLVKHRAITQEASDDILKTYASDRLLKLLNAIGFLISKQYGFIFAPPTGHALLLNALRQTGHHHVANYLDSGRRIKPYLGNCTNSKDVIPQRRHGQLSIWIQLIAVKVCPSVFHKFNKSLVNNDQKYCLPSYVQELNHSAKSVFGLSSYVNKTTDGSGSVLYHQPDQESRLNEAKPNLDQTIQSNKKSKYKPNFLHLLFSCFLCGLNKNKFDQVQSKIELNLENTNSIQINCLKPDRTDQSQQFIYSKSDQLNQILIDSESKAHDALIKYLEQSLGLLVLNCHLETNPSLMPKMNSAVRVDVVATRCELIKRLIDLSNPSANPNEKDCTQLGCITTSKLIEDISLVLIRTGLLDQLELQNFCLSASVDSFEVQIAIKELIDLNE